MRRASTSATTASAVKRMWEAMPGSLDVDCVVLAAAQIGEQEHSRTTRPPPPTWRPSTAGPSSTLLHVANRLKEQGHGAIVVLSSVAGERIRKSNFVYGAKAAIDSFSQGLGGSLAGSGVVLVVRPGFVHTSMTEGKEPAPLATTADVVAAAVADGLASGKHVVWVPGTFRWLMVAFRHLPRACGARCPPTDDGDGP